MDKFVYEALFKDENKREMVEVVRCKNCEFNNPEVYPDDKIWCTNYKRYMKKDGFCSEGIEME